MLTDDQLAHDLADAFHSTTAGLTYSGRVPRSPRTSTYVAPAVAVAGVAAVVAVTAGGHGSGQVTHGGPAVAAPQAGSPSHLVAKHLRLEGFTMTYTAPASDDPMVARVVSDVPSQAQRVTGDQPDINYYIGTDPATGYLTGYVERADGEVFAISSPDATRAELLAMFQAATARAVPLVGGSNS